MKALIATIIRKNQVAQAKVMLSSFLRRHPNFSARVLVTDSYEGYQHEFPSYFSLVSNQIIEEIDDGDVNRYSAKLVRHLFESERATTVVYASPDYFFLNSVGAMDHLKSHNMIVLPKVIQAPWENKKSDSSANFDGQILDPGFWCAKNSIETIKFLSWVESSPEQKNWLTCGLLFNEGIYVLRRPEYGVGHWNLFERKLSTKRNVIFCNERQLVSFNFTAFDPHRPYRLGSLDVQDYPVVEALSKDYKALLLREGWADSHQWPHSRWTTPTASQAQTALP